MKLYHRDIDFLLKNVSIKSVTHKLREAEETLNSSKDVSLMRASILLSLDELLEIEDTLGELLAARGVTCGEINTFGRRIETLIDLVSSELQTNAES